MEDRYKRWDWDPKRINIDRRFLNNLRFADDVVLFGDKVEHLKEIVIHLQQEKKKIGL